MSGMAPQGTDRIVVGVDGTGRGERAMSWAARRAQETGLAIEVVSVVDSDSLRRSGIEGMDVFSSYEQYLTELVDRTSELFPDVRIDPVLAEGKVAATLTDRANAVGVSMVVVGTHHGSSVASIASGAMGLRISVSTSVPTAVIPADWSLEYDGTGVTCAVATDGSSDSAVIFAAQEARRLGEPLDLVSAWGLPPVIAKPAEAMGGGIQPVGRMFQEHLDGVMAFLKKNGYDDLEITARSVEGSSPAVVLGEVVRGRRVLVMGSHARSALGRAVFGSVTHSVLMSIVVPTIVVVQPKD